MKEKLKNNKSIVIGVTVLLLVTLLLLGLTYAYYRTRIEGNQNNKTLSVTSKNLVIKYYDGSAYFNSAQVSNTYYENKAVEPGDVFEKNFTVKNEGDEAVTYSLVFDNLNSTFTRSDWVYTLTKNGSVVANSLALKNNVSSAEQVILNNISIAKGATDTYKLTVTYKNLPTTDQSADMGKSLSFRVNITEESVSLSGVSAWDNAESGTLLYALKNNNTVTTPKTTPGKAVSTSDEAVLASTEDNYGISYYFRGNVKNNYINFSGMCWKIVRVMSDGGIKIVLANKNALCDADDYYGDGYTGLDTSKNAFIGSDIDYGYFNEMNGNYKDEWLQSLDASKLVSNNLTLLTSEEIKNAGATNNADNTTFYLIENARGRYFTQDTYNWEWDATTTYTMHYMVDIKGRIKESNYTDPAYIRPAAILKSTTTVTGSGTQTNPYVVS